MSELEKLLEHAFVVSCQGEAGQYIGDMSGKAALTELLALRARVAQLEAALTDAIECTEHWAAYASDYFKDKHDYAGDIVRLRAALKDAPR